MGVNGLINYDNKEVLIVKQFFNTSQERDAMMNHFINTGYEIGDVGVYYNGKFFFETRQTIYRN